MKTLIKKIIKIIIDIVMFIIFIYLMSYRPGRGLSQHGILGFTLFVLFILHHILNIKWYGTIIKGKYTFAKKMFIIINMILFLDMIIMAISSIMMSGDIFAFSPFTSTQFARNIHVSSTAWGFIFMILHIGLHTHNIFKKIYTSLNKTYFKYIYTAIFTAILCLGVYCFITSKIINSMLLIPKQNHSFYALYFYFEYIMMTIAASQIIHLIFKIRTIIKKQ
ncbi:DUF4405 domain-containing protein [Brachyspira sp. SAP_772]|uniref:DUF4405 domain-containing protein n=1 Tax=Brachyspira sp. SAP_772 TaxID=2608385 RepID=UPI0012F4E31D|nr:DUF4405 domain-containing protein [Brachyspira sp. SAP_772]